MIDYQPLIEVVDELSSKLDTANDNGIIINEKQLEKLIGNVIAEHEKLKKNYTDV